MSGTTCAVCRSPGPPQDRLCHVVVEGRSLWLCRGHAARVAAAAPETFEALRALFRGAGSDPPLGVERRSPISRRGFDDRRVFPPRPEGRRMSQGRRATDPAE